MMEAILNEPSICNVPDQNSYVYKDECAYCFNTLESNDGLFICMKSFIGVCKNHLELFFKKSNNRLFLNLKIEKRFKISKGEPLGDESEYRKLLKETFLHNKFEIKEYQRLFLMPSGEEITLPSELPLHVQMSVTNILTADCIAKASERGQRSEKWEDSLCAESKHARTLKQLDNGVKIPPSGWKCSQCDLTNNLWLNLTDGEILCGRKFFDGSGGNNHAIEHYKKTSYPLAVKLGTITPERADVFSYDEDNMVIDPLLPEHLAHFGIDIMKLQKTDKSVEEIEMENIKRNREQIAIMESESNLEQLHGPGFTGIFNTGNSCYISSVMQVLFTIPAFVRYYGDRYHSIITREPVTNDVNDFRVQISKLGYYLKSGDYSYPMKPLTSKDGELIGPAAGITPQMFRVVIGQNHADFSTKQQQDAYEFLIHLMGLVKKDVLKHRDDCGASFPNPLASTTFKVEDRVFCETSQTVKYNSREESVLSLSIALDEATNLDEIAAQEAANVDKETHNEALKPIVNLESCLRAFTRDDVIVDYVVNGTAGRAFHSSKLETFPDYLWLQLKRFTVGTDWMPKKLDVDVCVPDHLDLSFMAASGLQPGEVEMKDEEAGHVAPPVIELNADFVNQLLNMGFPENACKKAVYYTRNTGSVDDAANWLMVHIGEPDFDQLPPELQNQSTAAASQADAAMPDEADLQMMMNMGFTRNQATKALQETNNLERAADWAFNHIDELTKLEMDLASTGNPAPVVGTESLKYSNGEPRYSLVALISHIGTNAHVGHYVCHIKGPDGSWALFNDDKVQKSVNPPKQFAYLYLYKRDC